MVRESYHKLTVESVSWLVWYRLAIVQSQAVQHLDSVNIEVAHAAHQRRCLFRQLGQGVFCFFRLVLLNRQETGSQLLNVSLHKDRGWDGERTDEEEDGAKQFGALLLR